MHMTPFWNSYAHSQTIGKPNDLKDFGTIKPKGINMIATGDWINNFFFTLFRNCKIQTWIHLAGTAYPSEAPQFTPGF